ncbi:hypothetical protein N7539_008732 [Penicillium diatomitis]|uniref:Uncharacterized protein n=1 Tax=Penicillium diatomitis TaxID=2819901 RepID=A0A9X0BM76_9EURO|nr:uncharacterized protein N7539_008732 [Penicillium diatomitis]KAJ5472163.1 hypothetical protein N7539_008732 [Penicillium diatomitis]
MWIIATSIDLNNKATSSGEDIWDWFCTENTWEQLFSHTNSYARLCRLQKWGLFLIAIGIVINLVILLVYGIGAYGVWFERRLLGAVNGCGLTYSERELKGDEDFDRIDGWKGLSTTQQAAVRRALTERHIPDEDWKGDVECNRPGKRGFRLPKKNAGAKKDADEYSQSSEAEAGERTKMTARAKKATDEKDNIGKSRKLKPHTRGGKPEKKPMVDDSANEDANRYVCVEGRFFITTIYPYCGCSSQERKPFDTARTHTKDA